MLSAARLIGFKMQPSLINKLSTNAEVAEKRLQELKAKFEIVKKNVINQKIKDLSEENLKLAACVEKAKQELIALETLHGKKQYPIPGKGASVPIEKASAPQEDRKPEAKAPKAAEGKKKEKKIKEKEPAPTENESVVDVRKLDFRIGKIIDINKHPDADALYVEQIDCGEERPRTVVSGLVNHVPIEAMRNRIVMVLCNLKPVKMRGVTSEAMVMCASSPDKVEVLIPPSGSIPGDLVSCQGYPREPEPQLNPKKKIFETCAPDLKTNEDKVACYKGSPLIVDGKGPVYSETLIGVSVK